MTENPPEPIRKFDSDDATATDAAVRLDMLQVTKPWQELWKGVLRRHAEVDAIYRGRDDVPVSKTSEYWRDQVFDFFVACYSLKDHLKKTAPSAASAVEPYVHGAWSLSLCGAMANTYKHHTVYTGKATADITKTSAEIHGPTASVEGTTTGGFIRASYLIAYTDEAGVSGTIDSLDLADRSISDWRTFFSQHGLTEPGSTA